MNGLILTLLLSSSITESSAFRLSERAPSFDVLGQSSKRQSAGFESDTNGTEFLWTIEDTYDSSNFFDQFTFFDEGDPTHGQVNFLNQSAAFANGLAYVASDNSIVMKGDNTTWLASGAIRDSVRVQSIKAYNTSLIILDLNSAAWGCGEIDILEGVHDNEHNQITWHTAPGCNLTPSSNYTGTLSVRGPVVSCVPAKSWPQSLSRPQQSALTRQQLEKKQEALVQSDSNRVEELTTIIYLNE
ncbi:glycoside hydrolase family 16 protein [Athelia psychrophila]|uniref:Glycoside hydrolase family 16 protein n=1 Tax=Athelia psychrophila TaxID=1759441 RepID=A0A166CC32_9AGAM|nr:glycoside hydrolase family 16 protein [Fibularhizoctonia sp. CBS 109695]